MIRPITDTLRHIGGGVFIDTASDKLAELVCAVDSTGKAGKIDLTITVKKASRGGAMLVSGKVRLTKPAEAPMEAMLFGTPRATWCKTTRTSKRSTSRPFRRTPANPSP